MSQTMKHEAPALTEGPGLQTEAQPAQDRPADAGGLAQRLFASLPARVRDGLGEEARAAIAKAAEDCVWGEHEVDLRLSIPLISRRFYLVLLGGEERRSAARRKGERNKHPALTPRNLLFLGVFTSVFTVIGGFVWTVLFTWYLSS